jgi:hypothetical protein
MQMGSLKENLKLTAREAWDDFWEPLMWLISSNKLHREFSETKALRPAYQLTPLWQLSVILVPATLASTLIYAFSDNIARFIDLPADAIIRSSFIAIWGIAIFKIIFILFIHKKRRSRQGKNNRV